MKHSRRLLQGDAPAEPAAAHVHDDAARAGVGDIAGHRNAAHEHRQAAAADRSAADIDCCAAAADDDHD